MYALDTTEARKADNSGGSIKEMGKYIGTFTQAEDVTAKTGTKGIALTFESNGQKTRFTLYTMRADGEKIMGFQALSAIMACLKLRSINPAPGQIKSRDYDTNTDVVKPGAVFPELCNKPIGMLLETEDYLNNKGEPRVRMVFAGAFQADTELTASEILDKKTQPVQLARMVAYMRHRTMKNGAAKPSQGGITLPAGHPAATGSGFDDMNDDIPF